MPGTDYGMYATTPASQNRTLTELDLDRNINITEKGVGQLYAKIAQMGNERFQVRYRAL